MLRVRASRPGASANPDTGGGGRVHLACAGGVSVGVCVVDPRDWPRGTTLGPVAGTSLLPSDVSRQAAASEPGRGCGGTPWWTPQTHTPPRPSPSRSLARGGDGRRPRVRPCLPPRFKQGALVPHTPTQRGRGRRAAHLHRSQCVVGVCGDDHTRQVWRTLRRNAAKSTISTADSDPAGWNGRAGCRDPSPHGGATCAGEGAGRDSLRWRPATCPLPCVG